jgi:membrane associated rhomboid family serine protease
MAQVELIAKRHRAEVGPEPDADWKFWPALLGLPVEWEDRRLGRVLTATWTLAALMTMMTVGAFLGDPRAAIEHLGLVPADPWRYGGLTLVTSFLLHGGILHLVSNLYFLLMFGDDVEDDLGRWPYAGMIVAGALAGDLLHATLDPRPRVPLVGASTAISAMIVFYGLRFPQARLGLLLRFWFVRVRWVRFPAWAGLIGWVGLQLLGAWQQISGFSNVSALGHLGGAAAGFAFWVRARPTGEVAGGTAGPTDVWAWLGRDPQHRLAIAMIVVGALVVVLMRPLGLGVGTGALFLAAQLAYCSRFEVVDDWLWAFLTALLAFWFFLTRGVPWDAAVALASAVGGFVVAYRVLRARDRALLED